MTSGTLDETAREAVAAACAEVREADDRDAVDGVTPLLVARPESTDQVAEVMRAAASHRLTVVPRGNGTKLSWGAPPESADLVVDLSGLNRVLDHAAGDLIVDTQAGVALADLQCTVAEGGQRLALDETVAGSTVGGALATNTSGARRVAVGTARDLLIGVTVVRADGVVAKAGGRVVKNVAGYDLGKLVVGSFGTLAVVTEAVFRLHPLAAARRWVSVTVDEPGRAHDAVQAAVHSQAVPAAVEVDWLGAGDGAALGSVHVLLEGREDGVVARAESVSRLLDEVLTGSSATTREDAPADGATYPWDTGARGDERRTALKLTFALSGLPDVLSAARSHRLDVRGSAGAGVVYAALVPGTSAEDASAALRAVREVCTRHGGSTVVLDAPAAMKAALDVWGPVPAIDLMRRVKDQFDPDHRLAPGRFVGGI